jgi:hypothetical protein
MPIRLLYPSDPSDPKLPDEPFAAEYDAGASAGLALSLFSFEEFETGGFRPRPSLGTGEQVLYRGWMLAESQIGSAVPFPSASLVCESAPSY